MEIDWFWLAVICAIGGLTITIGIRNYFEYKIVKVENDKPQKEEKDNHNDGA
jgi:hypothetical protein